MEKTIIFWALWVGYFIKRSVRLPTLIIKNFILDVHSWHSFFTKCHKNLKSIISPKSYRQNIVGVKIGNYAQRCLNARSVKIKKKIISMCTWKDVHHVHAGAWRGQKRVPGPPELELTSSCEPTAVDVGNQPRSSARAACASTAEPSPQLSK